MASVKVDIHKNEREFSGLSLSDPNVIKWLILYRDKVDIYYGSDLCTISDSSGIVKEMNQELINTYICLDDLIDECGFSEDKKALIELVSMGFTFKDISELSSEQTTAQNVKRRFISICKAISEMNYRIWLIWASKNFIADIDFKVCDSCREELPATTFFFSPNKKGKFGLRNVCKKCR